MKLRSDSFLTAYIDGASRGNPGPGAIGVIIEKERRPLLELSQYIGHTTNNVAEYTALITAIEETLRLGGEHLHVFSDSQLVVRQMDGSYKVKSPNIVPLFQRASTLCQRLKSFHIEHIERAVNSRADDLADRIVRHYQSGKSNLRRSQSRPGGRSAGSTSGEESPGSAGQGGR